MIEPIQMYTALAASATSPLVFSLGLRLRPTASLLASIATSNILTHMVFYIVRPDFHHGPTYSIAIMMYLFITGIISAVVVAIIESAKGSRAKRSSD